MSSTTVMRVPSDVHEQITRTAALCGEQPGALLAQAWKEFLLNHKDALASDLERAAHLIRSESLDELVAFAQDSHRVVVDEDELRVALENPRLVQFVAEAVASGERADREGRRF